jgi:hypothetical protein
MLLAVSNDTGHANGLTNETRRRQGRLRVPGSGALAGAEVREIEEIGAVPEVA